MAAYFEKNFFSHDFSKNFFLQIFTQNIKKCDFHVFLPILSDFEIFRSCRGPKDTLKISSWKSFSCSECTAIPKFRRECWKWSQKSSIYPSSGRIHQFMGFWPLFDLWPNFRGGLKSVKMGSRDDIKKYVPPDPYPLYRYCARPLGTEITWRHIFRKTFFPMIFRKIFFAIFY